MIDIEALAKKLDSRDGAKVVAYREVGLPLFRVPSLLTLQEDGSLGAIEEFVLRAILQGVDTSDAVEKFLGLPPRIVISQLGQLSFEGTIAQVDSSPPRYALTPLGKHRVEEASSSELTKERISIYVDGITRDVVAVEPQQLWSNDQLERLGISVVPPTPRRPPKPAEIDLSGVNRMFSLLAGVERPTKRALRLDAIVGRVSVVFRRAIALAFKSEDGKRVSIGFAIDGRSSEEHEVEFARSPDAQRSVLFGTMFDADRRRRDVQAVAREVRADLKEILPTQSAAGSRKILTIRKPSVQAANVRVLSVYEHPPLLRMAFEKAKKRILIVSPWIRANVVDHEFIKRLASCLDRGVEVTIGYGIGKRDNGERPPDQEARESLVALAKGFANFRFVRKGNTHAKVLLVDDTFFVTTSFNWLSFKGDPNQPMREEEGTMVEDERAVEAYFQTLVARLVRISSAKVLTAGNAVENGPDVGCESLNQV